MNTWRLLSRLVELSVFAMGLFGYLFISRNAPGFTNTAVIIALGLVYFAVYLLAARHVATFLRRPGDPGQAGRRTWPVRLVLLGLLCLLEYLFLDSVLFDYYQPLSLFDEAIAALAAWWGLLMIAAIGLLATRRPGAGPALRAMSLAVLWACAAWPLAASLQWVNQPQTGEAVAFNRTVFNGGEDGYDVYRIPGLVMLPAGSRLADGQLLNRDRLVAFAEARRDGALDNGVIDLVMKSSDDGGANWSAQNVVCRNLQNGNRGKCGNPTPVFDAASGTLFLAYNLSGAGYDSWHHSSHLMQSPDGGLSWGEPQQLGNDNFVFGPGKGLLKNREPFQGRLLLPGHADGVANVLYSDDNGQSWHRGDGLAGGNESDLAELSDGRLYLATRHPVPVSRPPEPNGRKYSVSEDGGVSWSAADIDTALPTPVCQVSVLAAENGKALLFTNPAHHRARVNLSLRLSLDDGHSWPVTVPLWPGPAGYSVLALDSSGNAFVLYENGNMAYSERISLARVDAGMLIPAAKQ